MEHEDNAQFDNFLQNRLAESLQNAGSAGNAADVAAELVPNIGPKSGEHDGEHDDDEEWKYIKEVQQSEKQQQQEQFYGEKFNDADVDADVAFGVGVGNGIGIGIGKTAVGNGNGVGNSGDAYMSLGMDLSLGNGVGSAAGFRAYAADSGAAEEEDIEVIKNDGDLSTNSNTTTTSTTGEVEPPMQPSLPELQQQQLPQDEADEDEDEPSSVATTYGTSSLSEQHQEPEQLVPEPQAPLEHFDNKENADPTSLDMDLEPHSQLNPNAVEFVPHFGSQPSSPAPASNLDPMQTLGRQLIADDLVAESPRKGARDMDIALPDESEFDNEAAQRPHELEQEDDTFPDNIEQLQMQNGASVAYEQEQQQQQQPSIDHGPETSVDLDADLDLAVQTHQSDLDFNPINQEEDDIMKRSIYGVTISNAPIEDILNSVQPLPQQTPVDEPLKEKELLNVEEKELVSQSPSIEELHQQLQQQPLDPMQESFYLEHTSSDAFAQQVQDHDQDQSLLLDTSAPMFSPLEDLLQQSPEITETIAATTKTLDLQPEQADIVDITPSPLSSSTEEKHLVEETKEQQEQPELLDLDEPEVPLSDNLEIIQSAGPPSQVEYADFNTATGYNDVYNVNDNETPQINNPLADEQLLGSSDADFEFIPQQQLQPEPYNQELFEGQLNREEHLYQEEELHQKEQLYQQEPLYNEEPHFEEQMPPQEELQQEQQVLQHMEQQYPVQDLLEEQQEEPAMKQESQTNYNELLPQDELIEETHAHQLNADAAPFINGVASEAFIEPQLESRNEELEEPVRAEAGNSEPQEELLIAPEPVVEQLLEQPIVPEPVVEQLLEQVVKPVQPETPVEIVAPSEPVEPVVTKEEETPVAEVAVAAVAATAAVAAVAATAVAAASKPKIKASPADASKKPTPKTTTSLTATAAKAKPATAPITKKTSAPTTAAAPKAAAARPRTAPSVGATKSASSTAATTTTSAAAAKPIGSTSARKPLAASNATGKPAPRTLSARPATAPVSKTSPSGLSSKPPAAAARGTATAPTTARKPATSTATTGSTSQVKSRLQVTTSSSSSGTTAAAKPKVPSPRSTMASTLRKSAPVTSSISASRSPTKPLTNGVAKTSTVNGSSSTTTTSTSTTRIKSATGSGASASNTTTTTTITKTFTARPAPKFTHSTTGIGGASSARRPASSTSSGTLGVPTTTAQRKLSPLKSASSSPLKPKAKETAKASPAVGLKTRKSVGGTTPGKITAVKSAPAAATEPASATNNLTQPETKPESLSQNGNGLHDVLEAAQEALSNLETQQPQQLDEPALYSFVDSRGDF